MGIGHVRKGILYQENSMSDHSVKSLMALGRAEFLSLSELVMSLWVTHAGMQGRATSS